MNRQTKLLTTTAHTNFILVGLFGFIFDHMLTFIRYIEVYFTITLLDCVRYNEDFLKSRFCSIHFTVILAGLTEKIVRYTEDFVTERLVKSSFHCNIIY